MMLEQDGQITLLGLLIVCGGVLSLYIGIAVCLKRFFHIDLEC